jgi:hypothetical protein
VVPSSTAATNVKLTVSDKTNIIIRNSDTIVKYSVTAEVQDEVMTGEGDSKRCNCEGYSVDC